MTKFQRILTLLVAAVCGGCTTISLERYTLNQVQSSKEFQIKQVLNALATVAANPDALPSFAVLEDGISRVQDTETLNAITVWTRAVGSFASQNLGVTLSRMPQGQWTVDPVVDDEQLAALRCACQWVLYGPEAACKDRPGLLTDPQQDFSPGPHFGVADRLAHLPPGWLHVGRITEVPAFACSKAHCGNTWVWVMPDGTEGLADFILVLLDIATLDPASGANPPPLLVTLTKTYITHIPDLSEGKGKADDKGKKGKTDDKGKKKKTDGKTEKGKTDDNQKFSVLSCYQEIRMIRPENKRLIEDKILKAVSDQNSKGKVDISWDEWMRYSIPYHGTRANTSPQGGMSLSTPRNRTMLSNYRGFPAQAPPPGGAMSSQKRPSPLLPLSPP